MKVTAIGIVPPPGAKDNPKVTPELLASCLAKYSRSNKGIDSILQSIDWNDPDKAVDAIFRFVDYGHASITGMSGGIAIVVDGCSMYLAYKIFEIAQLCDGQESSTRYIKLDKSSLPDPKTIGIPDDLAAEWLDIMGMSFELYQDVYDRLDAAAQQDPSIVRLPPNASQKVADRLRKNYALDRARYFIPFATRTNAAYVMTARVWAETVKILDSLPLDEAHACAAQIRAELNKFVPRMVKHSTPDTASTAQSSLLLDYAVHSMIKNGISFNNAKDNVFIGVERNYPDFLGEIIPINDSFNGKANRYSACSSTVKRMVVRAAWNNMAIAELRDLNRHRSGYRFTPMVPVGFYLPQGVSHERQQIVFDKTASFLNKLVTRNDAAAAYVYALHLGTQVAFEHSVHADKFIYEIELRTGMGAHFRYAEHLAAAAHELCNKVPELKQFIQIGTAEPE
ncbi:MAG: FAD-dependent thymidylate synthase [Fibrobacterota bacterium]|nr:FAD-dependent thymidylate synthase [Chitinispirillaceae bacterium]